MASRSLHHPDTFTDTSQPSVCLCRGYVQLKAYHFRLVQLSERQNMKKNIQERRTEAARMIHLGATSIAYEYIVDTESPKMQ